MREMGDRKAVENCEAGKGAQPLLLPVPELQPGVEAQEDSGAEFHWDTKQRDTHMRAGWGNKSRLKRVRKKVLDVLRSPAQRLQFYLCQLRAKDAATPIANKSACRARHSMACLAVQLGQHSSPGAVVGSQCFGPTDINFSLLHPAAGIAAHIAYVQGCIITAF